MVCAYVLLPESGLFRRKWFIDLQGMFGRLEGDVGRDGFNKLACFLQRCTRWEVVDDFATSSEYIAVLVNAKNRLSFADTQQEFRLDFNTFWWLTHEPFVCIESVLVPEG